MPRSEVLLQMVHVMIAYLIVAYLYISVLLWSVALGMEYYVKSMVCCSF